MKNLLKKMQTIFSPFGGRGAKLPLRGLGGLLLVLGSFSSCSLADALKPTPQIDQYGLDKNATFACLVNGQKWEPGKNSFFQLSTRLAILKDTISILSSRYEPNLERYDLIITNFQGVGKYSLNNKIAIMTYYPDIRYGSRKEPKTYDGSIEITTYDKSKKTISGTFNFAAAMGLDTFRITQGRFNLVATN
jgi:hypothetical protein